MPITTNTIIGYSPTSNEYVATVSWPAPMANVCRRQPYPPFATNPAIESIRRRPIMTNQWTPPQASTNHANTNISMIHRPPYAVQNDSLFNANGFSRAATEAALPSYCALNDPHLRYYFERKFTHPYITASTSALQGRSRIDSGLGRRGIVRKKSAHTSKSKKGEPTYSIAIVTGSKKGCATDARVFIRIKGTKGYLPKVHLAKKISGKSKNSHRFKFNKGTTHIFKVKGKDIGEINSCILEHDGLTKDEGWYVEHVEIQKKMGDQSKVWLFMCKQWFSLHESDMQISRELFSKSYSNTEYEVVVVTGNEKGSGTDANVSLIIFGRTGQSNKKLLTNGKRCFERNQSDIFNVRSRCVGPLTKIRIMHDNIGFRPGWFLERVVITDLKNPKSKCYFPCGQWLAKDEADGSISRDLLGSSDPLAIRKSCKYKVTVYTGDKMGAGTDACVFITLFGDLGDSGERTLDSARNNFERAKTDEFTVDSPSLGQLNRIRISHDNSGPGPGWFLDKIIVDDTQLTRVYEFPCNRWLAKNEDDGAISRDLICGGDSANCAIEGTPYTLHITTGDKECAGTSARVFVNLHSNNLTSGRIWLDSAKCSRARTDVVRVDVAEDLKALTHLEVGHDNSGPGSGWFLDKIIVTCAGVGLEQHFLCDDWLAADEGKGTIEKTLYESKGLRKTLQKLNAWFIKVFTSDRRGAGTDANVKLVAYGKNKQNNGEVVYKRSDDVMLDNKGDNFEAGQEDQFKVEMSNIGTIYKIRVGHDNKGSFAGWHLDKNMATKKIYIFKCNRWLAEDEEDLEIVREIPLECKKPEKLKKYSVSVYTGNKRGAGTDANVFLELIGQQGDTGERPLRYSSNNQNKFERNSTDEFIIEAVDLKEVKRIRIGHDGSSAGSGWFLDKVVVCHVDDSDSEAITFECNRWLDINEDDGLIVREITAGGSQMLNMTSYVVSVQTGDISGAGTDANVTLRMFGADHDSGTLALKSSESSKNKFERGRTDIFRIESSYIGKISHIRLGHDGKSAGSGWFLDECRIEVPSKGENYVFACHRWLDKSEEDGATEIEIQPTHFEQSSAKIAYEITVWTGSERSAGTDANVFLQIYGINGKTEEYQLRNRTDNFETAQVDKFKIEAIDVGPLQKIRVGHDDKGMFAGWYLDKILIQRYPSKTSKLLKRRNTSAGRRESSIIGKRDTSKTRRNTSAGRQSIGGRDSSGGRRNTLRRGSLRSCDDFSNDEDEIASDAEHEDYNRRMSQRKSLKGRLNISPRSFKSNSDDYESEESEFNRKSYVREVPSNKKRQSVVPKQTKDLKRRSSKYTKDSQNDAEAEIEEYWFICDRWLAKGEDDGKIVRELVPTDERGNPIKSGLQELTYKITVFTGDVFGGGTDANIYCKLTGEYGDSGERSLSKSDTHTNKFERKQEDVFIVNAIDLGPLKKVKIRHDNKGGGAAWFLGYIEVECMETKKSYFLPCERWLAIDEDDGQIMRELVPVDKSLKSKLSRKDSTAIRNEIGLEQAAVTTTYHVKIFTGDKFGAGTDSSVYVKIFGTNDDTGIVSLKSSKNHSNKFERNQMDEFLIQAIDIGDIKKIRIGHNSSGIGGAWYLEKIEIDCPSLGRQWTFACNRWLAKDKDDGKLERDLVPADQLTEEYAPYIPYELTVYTSDISGAGTDADVYVVLFGREKFTEQKSLCVNKRERKSKFERKSIDKFVVEMEDIGESIEKIRIGHDGSGLGAGWHLDKIEVRRLTGKGSETYIFNCKRWLASNEDDGAIVRELAADKLLDEYRRKDGTIKTRQVTRKDTLIAKIYDISVFTGDMKGGGTDANVFLTIFGDKGDSGERKLAKSKTHRNKFERAQEDIFKEEAIDLGKLYKINIRHDNALISPAWFLDRIVITDQIDSNKTTFHCERWLAKNKDDGKIERQFYAKGYDPCDASSTSTMRSHRFGSTISADNRSTAGEPFQRSPRSNSSRRATLNEIPEAMPYTVRIITGADSDAGYNGTAWIRIFSNNQKKDTGKIELHLTNGRHFTPRSDETFSLEGLQLKSIKKIEIGIESISNTDSWYVEEVELDQPTLGKHYYFKCKSWLGRGKSDGKTSRLLVLENHQDANDVVDYKPSHNHREISYEVTIYTGDVSGAGTDSNIKCIIFGSGGATSSEIDLPKQSERFERGQNDLIKIQLEDITPLKKLRIWHDGKGDRNSWNMANGDLTVFKADAWLSKTKGNKNMSIDLVALIRGKSQLKITSYRIQVKTSDIRGASTSANVSLVIFGEYGDSGTLKLSRPDGGKSPFSTGSTDCFSFTDQLSLGQLVKARVWHDNKGFRSAWHLSQIEVEDTKTRQMYLFPCNRWLSTSDDDRQVCRELSCANLSSPNANKEKIDYKITVITGDKRDAGTIHNAWIVLEGEIRSTKVFPMENSSRNKILRRGQTDNFTLVTRNIGKLEKCILGACEREDAARTNDFKWFCYQIIVTTSNNDKYTFNCNSWIEVHHEFEMKQAKIMKVSSSQESQLTAIKNIGTVKYTITVVTGSVRGAGTDANVSCRIFGDHGDTGPRPLKQKGRDLFERNQKDEFIIEALDLGLNPLFLIEIYFRCNY